MVALWLLGSGCAVGGSSIDEGDLVSQVEAFVTDRASAPPESVECPGLAAEVGAEATCTVVVDGQEGDVVVTVTGVDGGDVDFDATIDEALLTPQVPSAQVADQVATQLAQQNGLASEPAVTCPEDLPAEVGAVITCVTSDGADEYDTTVEVTAVRGDGTVEFDIQVADTPT